MMREQFVNYFENPERYDTWYFIITSPKVTGFLDLQTVQYTIHGGGSVGISPLSE